MGIGQPVLFSLNTDLRKRDVPPGARHVLLIAPGVRSENVKFIEGTSISLPIKKGAVIVIGDPFDPMNDPAAIAEALRIKIPSLQPARIVTATPVLIECAEQSVDVKGLISDRTAPGFRCTVTDR